jgi:hypothetical protein
MQTRSWPSLPVFDAARARVEGEELLLRSETDRALARFRRAAELDPVSRPRDFLGFALMRAGKHSEAAAILNVLGSDRATVWQEPEWQWPGLCRYSREQSILHSPRA